jgi:hypothetical protein
MKIIARVMDVIRRLSPRCREAARMISYSADRSPALLDRVGLFVHVLICTPCRRYRQSVEFMKRKMKQIAELPAADAAQSMPGKGAGSSRA